MSLLGVHLADGFLSWPWLAGGWTGSIVLLALCSRRVSDETIPKMGVMTALFFVGSQVHLRLAGLTTVHLLLNGVLAVRLGWHAIPAIFIGLLFQLLLFAHGGWLTLGLNHLLYSIPVVACISLLGVLRRRGFRLPVWLHVLLGLGVVALVGLVIAWLAHIYLAWHTQIVFAVTTLILLGLVATFVWRFQQAVYRLGVGVTGLWLGLLTASLTVGLNMIVIALGANQSLSELAPLVGLSHVPVIVIEGLVTAALLNFLATAQHQGAETKGITSSNGTSH